MLNNLGSPAAGSWSPRKQGVVMIGQWVSDFSDIQLESLINQYYVDIGLITTASFMVGDSLSDTGILRDDAIIN